MSVRGETAQTIADAAIKANAMKTVIGHLKENRLEYAVFTMLLYTLGALDKVWTYGTNMCV